VTRPDQTVDPAEAGTQLLLVAPPRAAAAGFADELDAALAEGGIAAVVVALGALDPEPAKAAALARPLRAICAGRGVAFVIRDDLAAALALGADGLHLDAVAEVAACRAALGGERILGVSCGLSRDAAMTAGEAGADYVAFGDPDQPPGPELYDLLEWWSGLFVLPCLAEVVATPEDYARLTRAGADFIAAGATVWEDPDGPAAALRGLKTAIATA
jgi:thiamine-phosphate pyrophosphorylase